MKVIVAGATGAIGKPLLRALSAAGHQVYAVLRRPESAETVAGLGAVPVVADVMDRDALLRAVDGLSADAVMHQATALSRVGRSMRNDPTIALRTTGSEHLIEAARATGARRFVTQSLITGYGYRDHGDDPVTEAADFGVLRGTAADPVVSATATAERLAFETAGLDGVALRYGMFYGPGAFSDQFAGLLRKRVPWVPRGGGGTISFIQVQDAATGAVAALERGRPGTAYNLVDDEPASWGEFARVVAEAHRTPRPVHIPHRLLRLLVPYLGCLMIDTTLRASHQLATADLGWRPSMPSIRDGLA